MGKYLPEHSVVKQLDTIREELDLQMTQPRLRIPLHLLMYILHGKVDAKIQGVENLITAAKIAKDADEGFVVATTHESGLDVPTAAWLASKIGPVSISAASTNLDPIKRGVGGINPEALQYMLAGRVSFYPVPYDWQTRSVKVPRRFSAGDYDELVRRVCDGDIAIVSAFSDHESVKHRKVGSAAAHTALAAGVSIVPVIVLSNQAEAFSSGVSLAVLKDHALSIDIGEPITTTRKLSTEYNGADDEGKAQIRRLIRDEMTEVYLH